MNKHKIWPYFSLLWLVLFPFSILKAQDLNNLMNENENTEKEFVSGTFKSTRLVNLHTIETQGRNVLEYRISHRFGDIGSGGYNAFGLDGGASMRMGLEYCFDGRLNIGLGRTNIDKTVDTYAKYRLLRQTTGKQNPVSITLLAAAYYTAMRDPNKALTGIDRYAPFSNRLSYCYQIMVARKFNEYFSLQVAPTMIHFNLVNRVNDKNDLFALAALGRVKITQRTAFTAEYTYRITTSYAQQKDPSGKYLYYNPFAIGFDIDTGGHIFQIQVCNSQGMIENQFIPFTTSSLKNWGLRLGFNISRVF